MIRNFFCLALLWSFAFSSAQGAEVIGISKPGKKSKVDSDNVEPTNNDEESFPSQEQPKPRKRNRRMSQEEPRQEEHSGAKNWGVSLSLGLGFRSFSGALTLSHYLNRYVGVDLSGFYLTRSWEDKKETSYGPELDFVLRFPNVTIITPFAGAGPGWVKWQRVENEINFETAASFTMNYFLGANLRLTDFLVFQVVQKWTTYLNQPPLQFENQNQREKRTKAELGIGLAAVL